MTTDFDKHIFGTPVPVIAVTGEKFTGKTIFLSSICPAETIMYDLEKSSETYEIPFKKRVDFYDETGDKDQTPLEVFKWFHDAMTAIKPGDYRVIAADPISDVEIGLADFVAAKHSEYGFSSAEKFKAMGGVFWGHVNAYYKKFLGMITSRCEVFAFSVHLRDQYKGDKRTGKKEPKGKVALSELASLYLWLERVRDDAGKYKELPKGTVAKTRLAHTSIDDDGKLLVIPILPPLLNPCTVEVIKDYIRKPVDYKKLKKNEYEAPHEMNEEEKLDKQKEIADSQAEAETAALQREELRMSAAEKIAARNALVSKVEQSEEQQESVKQLKEFEEQIKVSDEVLEVQQSDIPDLTVEPEADDIKPAQSNTEKDNPFELCLLNDDDTIDVDHVTVLTEQFDAMGYNGGQIRMILSKTKSPSVADLRFGRAKIINSKLADAIIQKQLQTAK